MIKCIGIIPHNKSKQKQKRQMFEFVNSFSLSPFFSASVGKEEYRMLLSNRNVISVNLLRLERVFFCCCSVQLLHINILQREHRSTSSCAVVCVWENTHTHEIKRRKAALYLQTLAQHGICFSVTRHSFSLSDLCIPCY